MNREPLTIYLVDSIMGSYKTTKMHKGMYEGFLENPNTKIVYISPLIAEVGGAVLSESDIEDLEEGIDYDRVDFTTREDLDEDRLDIAYYQRGRIQKVLKEMDFRYPVDRKVHGRTTKRSTFMELIREGHNISTTHNLFNRLTIEDVRELKDCGYHLIIDEVADVIIDLKMSRALVDALKMANAITVRPNGSIKWHQNVYDLSDKSRFKGAGGEVIEKFATACINGSAYLVNGKAVLSVFPYEVLTCFETIIVMTYLFDGSVMKGWCEINNANVIDITSELNLRKESDIKKDVRELVKLYEPKTEFRGSISQSGYLKISPKTCEELKTKLDSYARWASNNHGYTSGETLITCPKDNWENVKKSIKSPRISKATWLCSTTRATNEYRHMRSSIYALSKNINPMVEAFLLSNGYSIDKKRFALAEMLQWIWRGAVRDGGEMGLYIVDPKMRTIFKDWLYDQQTKTKTII